MSEEISITIVINGLRQEAQLICEHRSITLSLRTQDGKIKSYTGANFFKCFGNMRKDNPDIIFMCKGAKKNVHPSSMSAQMSLGLKAYELTLGKEPLTSNVVHIFDFEDHDLTNDPQVQINFYHKWIEFNG